MPISTSSIEIHSESLLRLPLVRQMLEDPGVRLTPRAIDCGWYYSGAVPVSTTGFNPQSLSVYYGARSLLAQWLANPSASARTLNDRDLLVKEVLFAVHDYLHCWAYLAIQNLAPELGFGQAPIDESNAEKLVFCHLLTETAATVGLDYWYLGTLDLNDVCDIGTRVEKLSTSYHVRRQAEYLRFNPAFDAQQPAFFGTLARFYCTGAFEGFKFWMFQQSPLISEWLGHEVRYGRSQRRYSRQWLAHLSEGRLAYTDAQLDDAVADAEPWQQSLTQKLGALLWDKVKNGRPHYFERTAGHTRAWASREPRNLDFRFMNAAVEGRALSEAFSHEDGDESFKYFLYQFVSQHEFTGAGAELEELFSNALLKNDLTLLQSAFSSRKKLVRHADEPSDLILLA